MTDPSAPGFASVVQLSSPQAATRLGSALTSIGWVLGQTFVARLLQAGAQVVLGWLLAPENFGILALAITTTHVVVTFFNLGYDDALLQRLRGARFWVPSLFWVSLVAGASGCAALLLIAPIAAIVLKQPELVGVLAIMAIANPIGALGTVPSTLLRASMRFRTLSLIALGEVAASCCLMVALAWAGFGTYSFVIPIPIVAAGRVAALWLLAERTPILGRSVRRWRRLFPAASATLGSRLLMMARDEGDYLVLGLLSSTHQVGLYFFAFRIAVQPMRVVAQNVSTVLFPALVEQVDDPRRQRDMALQASELLAVVLMPLCFIQAAVAGPFLELVFGSKWSEAVILIQLLTIGLGFDAASWTAATLLPARGEFSTELRYRLLVTPVFILAVLLGAFLSDATGTALGVAAYYVLVQPLYFFAILRRCGLRGYAEMFRVYLLPASNAALSSLSAISLAQHLGLSMLASLLVIPSCALLAYTSCAIVFSPNAARAIGDRAARLLGRSFARA
jgi:O-antigen/teichoic acid export membrane protein